MDFYESWHFLKNHPKFYPEDCGHVFPSNLDIMVVRVNPKTDSIDDDEAKNTHDRVWLEFGPWEKLELEQRRLMGMEDDDDPYFPMHDIDLDCGGETFEKAIINLASLVREHYGSY